MVFDYDKCMDNVETHIIEILMHNFTFNSYIEFREKYKNKYKSMLLGTQYIKIELVISLSKVWGRTLKENSSVTE